MENKITVFVGDDIDSLKEMLIENLFVREFKFEREESDICLSESDHVLYCLKRRCECSFFDNFEPIVFGDFLSRVDEAIDVKSYFEELLALGVPILYFAEHESSVKRLRECDLPLEVYKKDE